ncbi:uncharacterized [Tachysurus ichikawai]
MVPDQITSSFLMFSRVRVGSSGFTGFLLNRCSDVNEFVDRQFSQERFSAQSRMKLLLKMSVVGISANCCLMRTLHKQARVNVLLSN